MNYTDLRNKYTNKIIDIMGAKVKKEKDVEKNRDKILSYINETYDVTSEQLAQPTQIISKELPLKVLEVKNVSEFRKNIIKFMLYLVQDGVGDSYNDGGYGALISYYFYLSNKLLNKN